MIALVGISCLLRPYADCSVKNNKPIFIVLFILLVMQNFVFGKPRYWYENPTYAIFKRLGYVESSYANSLYNIKGAASIVNAMSSVDDVVLVGNNGISPYLKAKHVAGTEMNLWPDFFSYYAVSLANKYNWKCNYMGVDVRDIDKKLREGEIQNIVDRGFIHSDLFKRMKGVFCLKEEKFGHRIYARCSKE